MGPLSIGDNEIASFIEERKKQLNDFTVLAANTYDNYNKVFGKIVAYNDGSDGRYYDIRYFSLNNLLVTVEFNTSTNNMEDWREASKTILDSLCFSEDDVKKK